MCQSLASSQNFLISKSPKNIPNNPLLASSTLDFWDPSTTPSPWQRRWPVRPTSAMSGSGRVRHTLRFILAGSRRQFDSPDIVWWDDGHAGTIQWMRINLSSSICRRMKLRINSYHSISLEKLLFFVWNWVPVAHLSPRILEKKAHYLLSSTFYFGENHQPQIISGSAQFWSLIPQHVASGSTWFKSRARAKTAYVLNDKLSWHLTIRH